jgi:hypothetical protein
LDLDLSVLDELADAADVAFVVEMEHFVHEKYEFRLMCVRYLASHGFTWFGEEIQPSWGERTNRYLETGDESLLDIPDEAPWYMSGVLTQATVVPELKVEHARFARELRRSVPQVRWFGFDIGAEDTDYLKLANAANTYEELGPAMALRERRMHQRVDAVLASGEKVALMAGSTHLMKRDVDRMASGPGGGEVESIGQHVATGRRVLSIWMLTGSGETSSPWASTLEPQPGTLNAELAERYDDPVLVLPESDGDTRITQMHNLVLTCNLREQVDAIVFVPKVTRLLG